MSRLTSDLMREGFLKNDRIIEAFFRVSRLEFVPEDFVSQWDADVALPIGHGQTISQPSTVAFMLELLDPGEGQKIMDVGSGSGWTTAILSHIVGEKGKVIGIERIDSLKKIGEKNVSKFNYVSRGIANFILGDGTKGVPEEAPFDRILVSASGENVPEDLKKQLKVGGKMVIPVRNSIFFLEKKDEIEFEEKEYPGFSFVPLLKGQR